MSQILHQNRTLEELRQLPIIGKQPASEKEEKFLRELCEFEFYNLEEPGLTHRFPYGNSQKSHTFVLFHGGKYTVPRFVAQWIESRTTPIWDWRPDGQGRMRKKLVGHNPRFQMRQKFGG